jgi:acyl carrier protein
MPDVTRDVRDYILRQFLPGESAENLKDDTPLITSGILDSLATMNLVAHLEEAFGIVVKAHETGVDDLNTLNDITRLVNRKLG